MNTIKIEYVGGYTITNIYRSYVSALKDAKRYARQNNVEFVGLRLNGRKEFRHKWKGPALTIFSGSLLTMG